MLIRPIVTALLVFCLVGCGAERAARPAAAPLATRVPPTTTPAPTAAPTATPDAADALLALVQQAAQPNLADGAWEAKQTDFGNGPRVNVTMPLNELGSNEQIVRLNQNRMAGVMRALFEEYPELNEVNVIGQIAGVAAISLLVTREEYAAWSGTPAALPGWQVSGRLE